MPWKDASVMDLRRDFIVLAEQGEVPFTELCRRFGISPKTGRKWRTRYAEAGPAGLQDRSRRPQTSPTITPPEVVEGIRVVATANPTWGGRMIRHRLLHLGLASVPAASTITTILTRERMRTPIAPAPHPVIRFEADAPNHRWQMDFKGWERARTGRIVPFTVLDDHSRFLLVLEHTPQGTFAAVQALLTDCFRRYGLPWQLLSDNGPPWGSPRPHTRTQMDVWLLRLGVRPLHGRPMHPQTQGKLERLHKTLAIDLFQQRVFDTPEAAQPALDTYRLLYNHERPHSQLGFRPPADVYHPSPRPFPDTLPPILYDDEAQVRWVSGRGSIQYDGRKLFLSEALRGLPVGIYPTLVDGVVRIQFCARTWSTVDLRTLESE